MATAPRLASRSADSPRAASRALALLPLLTVGAVKKGRTCWKLQKEICDRGRPDRILSAVISGVLPLFKQPSLQRGAQYLSAPPPLASLRRSSLSAQPPVRARPVFLIGALLSC